MNLAKKIVQEFFQIPIAITEDLVQELADGLQNIFREYTMFVAACGKFSVFINSYKAKHVFSRKLQKHV